jgi:hypothetical protein
MGCRLCLDCSHLLGIHGDAISQDGMPQVCEERNAERALAALDCQAVLTKPEKNNTNVLQMDTLGITEDQNVIKENKHKLANEIMEHIMHHSLECHRSIGQAEWHDQELEVSMMGAQRHLGNVGAVHADLMVTAPQIQLGEVLCPTQFIEQLIDDRNGEHVAHGARIEHTVIDTEATRAIVLLHQEHRQ